MAANPVTLHVVIGPPAAGKTTWVAEHAKPGDIVIDYDQLALALTAPGSDPHDHTDELRAVALTARRSVISTALPMATTVDVYLIDTTPNEFALAHYHQLGAHIHVIDPGRDEVERRCAEQRPARSMAGVATWYDALGELEPYLVDQVKIN